MILYTHAGRIIFVMVIIIFAWSQCKTSFGIDIHLHPSQTFENFQRHLCLYLWIKYHAEEAQPYGRLASPKRMNFRKKNP